MKTNDSDGDSNRRLALILAKIGACHDMLINENEAVAGLGEGRRSRAVDTYKEALSYLPDPQIRFPLSEANRLDLLARARVLNNLGYALMATGGTGSGQNAERKQALDSMREALKIRTKLQDIGPNLARIHLNLAEICRLNGNVAGVYDHIASADAALPRPKDTRERHPIHAKLEILRACQHWEENKLDKAHQGFELALTLLYNCGLGESERRAYGAI